MECLRAQEVLSAAIDREAGVEELEAAKLHARDCRECASFLSAASVIATAPAPRAPEALVGSIMEAHAEEVRLAEVGRELDLGAYGEEPVRRGRLSFLTPRRLTWGFTAISVAAAGVIGVLVVTRGSQYPAEQAARDSGWSDTLQAPAASPGGEQAVTGQLGGEAKNDVDHYAGTGEAVRTTASAPSYVSFDGRVYLYDSRYSPDPSGLTTQGSLASAKDTGDAPSSWPVYSSLGDPQAIFVARLDGYYDRYVPVTRFLGGRRFVLTNGATIERYGVWPKFPPGMGTPIRTDGSPGFTPAGSDDTSVPVFASAGHKAEEGFAIAAGTAPDDPAAGNPNWTWWEPFD